MTRTFDFLVSCVLCLAVCFISTLTASPFPLFHLSTLSGNMARTTQNSRRVNSSKPPATIPAASPAPNSFLPPRLRFPLLVLSSLTLSSLLYSLVSPFTAGDLATVSKSRDNWWEIAGFLGWKATQLAIGWFGGFDSTISASIDRDANLSMVLQVLTLLL